jgi:hypothetical protein
MIVPFTCNMRRYNAAAARMASGQEMRRDSAVSSVIAQDLSSKMTPATTPEERARQAKMRQSLDSLADPTPFEKAIANDAADGRGLSLAHNRRRV